MQFCRKMVIGNLCTTPPLPPHTHTPRQTESRDFVLRNFNWSNISNRKRRLFAEMKTKLTWRWRKITVGRYHRQGAVRLWCCCRSGSVCVNFNWTRNFIHTHLTTRVANSDLDRIPLAPDHPKLNYCLWQNVSIFCVGAITETRHDNMHTRIPKVGFRVKFCIRKSFTVYTP